MAHGVNRRGLLLGGTATITAPAIAGCDLLSTEPTDSPEQKSGPKTKEAPMLADRVERTEVLQLVKEEYVGTGSIAPTIAYGTVSNRTQNFAKFVSHGTVWIYLDPAPSNRCQYFIEEG